MSMSSEELKRAALNRLMIAADITAEEAQTRLRAAFKARHGGTPTAALEERGLAWLGEDRAERERRALETLMREKPKRALAPRTPRVDRVPRADIAGLAVGITVTQGRMLDLRAMGATRGEIARIETISVHTVRNTLMKVDALLGKRGAAGNTIVWKTWAIAAGHEPDADLAPALLLLRGGRLDHGSETTTLIVTVEEDTHVV